ncbi:MAG: 16S rRNA (guanine(966)-N(2))-methyltransferase RsmD [Planctomycetaceae bacterium]|nr:16S rRNA (guanine(966)-N(2))-methyltransferase RsmD [Planctomycetaceae bacterium]
MRIIAGQYRRRKLLANTGMTTRPITDRAKEKLFENLGGELNGEKVADIFSGTGSLGLEALSRGASAVVCIERDKKAYDLLQENVATLGVEDQVLCWRADVFRCSFLPKGVEGYLPYDLIFYDPPFPLLKKLKPKTPMFQSLERLAREKITSTDARLIFRVPSFCEYQMPDQWTLDWKLPLSSMDMHIYRKSDNQPVEETPPEDPTSQTG